MPPPALSIHNRHKKFPSFPWSWNRIFRAKFCLGQGLSEFQADFVGGVLEKPAVDDGKVLLGDWIVTPIQAQRAFKPWLGSRKIARFQEMQSYACHSEIAIRIERLGLGKKWLRFILASYPIQAPAIAQEIITVPGVESHASLKPLHRFRRQILVILGSLKALNPISLADTVGSIEILRFDREGLLEKRYLLGRI